LKHFEVRYSARSHIDENMTFHLRDTIP